MKVSDTYTGNKIPKKVKWLYSTGTIARDAAYQLVSSFLLIYMQYCAPLGVVDGVKDSNLFMVQWGVITAIIIALRIWDGFNDPIMGWIVERAHFKSGKYKPWILIGGLSNAVVLFMMFYLRPEGWWYVLFFGVFYLLWDFTFTMNDIGYWSMLPSLSSDEKERNTITTMVAVCTSIGGFACVGLLPSIVGGNAQTMYTVCAAVISGLFALSQVILFLFCKEHKRDEKQEAISEKSSFTDMFKILRDNSQVRYSTIAMLLYYCGSSIITRIGLNYFYFVYNYSVGGYMMTLFTVFYAVGTLSAQIGFPFLLKIKGMTREKLFKISFWLIFIGYILFFLYGLKINENLTLGFAKFGETNIADIVVLGIFGILIFGSQGLFYLMLLVMMTNSIEYNEFKFGERKESVIFSLRPLTAKLADACKEGVYYLTFIVASLWPLFSKINEIENLRGAHLGIYGDSSLTEEQLTELAKEQANAVISGGLEPYQLMIVKGFMCLVPLLLFTVTYIIMKKKYFITEDYYRNMTITIEERKASTK